MGDRSTIKKLQLKQLDKKLSQLKPSLDLIPKEGWVRAIREALGMSARQLAERMGVSQATLAKMEKGEVENTVTLKTLERIAEALDCRLFHALVPRSSLEDMVRRQARAAAEKLVKRVSHSMELEKQGVSRKRREEQIEELADEMARSLSRDLWEIVK